MITIKQPTLAYPERYRGLLRVERPKEDKIKIFMVGSKDVLHAWALTSEGWTTETAEIPEHFIKSYKAYRDSL